MTPESLRAAVRRLRHLILPAMLYSSCIIVSRVHADTAPRRVSVLQTTKTQLAVPPDTTVPPIINPANFDSAVSPCEHFDKYANGGWMNRMIVPTDSNRVVGSHQTWTLMSSGTWRVLEDRRMQAPITTDSTIQAIGYFYNSCVTDTSGKASGAVGTPDRTAFCIVQSNNWFSYSARETFLRQVLRPGMAVRAQAQSFFQNLKAAAEKRIRAAPWVPDSSRSILLDQLAAMTLQIFPFEAWYDDTTKYIYRGPALTPTDYTKNVALLATAAGQQPNVKFLSPVYNPDENQVTVTHHFFLQSPIFDPTGDPAVNYGILGTVLGHEIMHAFDATRYRRWTKQFNPHLDEHVKRLIAHYDALGQNGTLTKDENVADLAGMLVAYDAFTSAMQGKPRSLIAGLTPEQRFFVAFANFWRSKHVGSSAAGIHAAETTRINGLLGNVPVFAKTFSCKAGDPMVVPADKRVEIW